MKILKVSHGYPMRYNAGSEVYSQTLCHGLAERHEVQVFTREEDSSAPDFRLCTEGDEDDPRILVHVVNSPRDLKRYRNAEVDQRFAETLDRMKPDIVHIGHLNHLSTSLMREAALREVPIVFTLHDYWLMCPRGQFLQVFSEDPKNPVGAVCGGQDDRKCAERCYAGYPGGVPKKHEAEVSDWSDWVGGRMRHVHDMAELVDLFTAPSRYLLRRFRDIFGLPESKLVYLDYGFARERMAGRSRVPGEPFTFGYIGTHIPAKGIGDLIHAFETLDGEAKLRIWGRPLGKDTEALKSIVASYPAHVAERVEWLPEYKNQQIVPDVFDRCDAIVVPSVWVENSPLVIHEAQQARVPVITADVGGMAEYVRHEVNGLLFKHRSVDALAQQMQRLVDEPDLGLRLGARGYLFSETGDIPSVDEHVREIERLYGQVLKRHASTRVSKRKGPWRITFDTNPEVCNLNCVMCEEHSIHSPLLAQRKAEAKQWRSMPLVQRKAEVRQKRLMSLDMIERVVAEAVPHGLREIIPSTMGEPLLFRDFEGILDICHRHGIKLNLTTNGTFPRLGAEKWAERIVPVASDVKISWNGATKETYEKVMRRGNWEKAVDNARKFIAARDAQAAAGKNRCSVTMQLTFMQLNVEELADMVRLAISLGMDRLKGHHLWAHFEEIEEESMRRSPEAIRRWNKAVSAAREAASERTLPNGKHILLENVFPLDDTATENLAPSSPCPFLGQEAWVSAVGRFDPCCAPDAERRTLGEFGNLNDQGFMEIWNGKAYRELVSTYRNRRLCIGCNMRKPASS